MMKRDIDNVVLFKFETIEDGLELNENFGNLLLNTSMKYDEELANCIPFPCDYTLALFSNLAYDKIIELNSHLTDWHVLTRAENKTYKNHYVGVAFWNPKLRHIVVAHQGTNKKVGDLINDILLALKARTTSQATSAASFVHRIVKEIDKQNKLHPEIKIRLSITGHSLGAWLAQYTTFTAKFLKVEEKVKDNKVVKCFVKDQNYNNNIHPHTVVFDSPGCLETLSGLKKELTHQYTQERFGKFKSLDMTVYLNKPNPVNSVNEQVGTIYLIPVPVHDMADVVEHFEINPGNLEKKVVRYLKFGFRVASREIIKYVFRKTNLKNVRTQTALDNVCSLNVFDDYEMEFVKDLWEILEYKAENKETILEKFNLPSFELFYKKNLIKFKSLDELNKFVARLKNLRPSKHTLFDTLKNHINNLERLELETQIFKKELKSFNEYYFNDEYNLKGFLESQDDILQIRVDENSVLGTGLESSILGNLFDFYGKDLLQDLKEEKFYFLKWKDLCKINVEDLKIYGLVAIECFESENESNLMEFLKKNSEAKFIILTTNNQFNWTEDNTFKIRKVNGLSNNLNVNSLNSISQQSFLNRNFYNLNDQPKNFNSFWNSSNSDKALPVEIFLKLLQLPKENSIELDCPYNNLLKGVLFESLYRPVENIENIRKIQNESTVYIIQENSNFDLSSFKTLNSEDEFESLCLQNSSSLSYLFNIKDDQIFLMRIFNPNLYIDRIINKKVLRTDFFHRDDLKDFHVFYGIKTHFDELMKNLPKFQRGHIQWAKSKNHAKEKINQHDSEANSHLFRIDEKEITWQYSVREFDSLTGYISEKDGSKESDIFKNENMLIISGESGIGKSSLIEHLYLNLKSTYWILVIQLKHYDFDSWPQELTYDVAANFIVKSCNYSNAEYVEVILSYCIQHQTAIKVCVMFDSFDEIYDKHSRHKIVDLINFLKETNVKILITTRPHASKELEKGLLVFSSRFKPLDFQSEIKKFFVDFWKSQVRLFDSSVNDNKLEEIADQIHKNAENLIGNEISNFIGIPMHLRLLAETITPTSSTSIHHNISDILILYQKYVSNQCNIYFRKFALSSIHKTWLEKLVIDKMMEVAIHKFRALDIDINDVEELYHVGLVYLDYNSRNSKFLHDSVRDYFIAACLQQWLTSPIYFIHANWNIEKFLTCDMFITDHCKIIRFFLNSYFRTLTVTPERSTWCKIVLEKILNSEPVDYVNENCESIIHICVKENLQDLLINFVFKVFSPTSVVKLLILRNKALETPLGSAIMANKVNSDSHKDESLLAALVDYLNTLSPDQIQDIILSTLFNHYIVNLNVNGDLTDFIQSTNRYTVVHNIALKIKSKIEIIPKFLVACEKGDLSEVQEILNSLSDQVARKYLVCTTNDLGKSGLHLTSNLDVVKLIKTADNVNLIDHHGMTALARAAKAGKTDIGQYLILEEDTQFIKDLYDNTPLMHAAKNGNLKILKYIIKKGSSSKCFKEIDEKNRIGVTALMLAAKYGQLEVVKSLIAHKANIDLQDRNEYTAFFYAVLGRHEESLKEIAHTNLEEGEESENRLPDYPQVVNVLLAAGSSINAKNRYGFTPLHFSIKNKKYSMVDKLLDRGADINLGNTYKNEYPLQVLIKNDQKKIITKVLRLKKKKNLIIDKSMLNKDELLYMRKNFPNS